MENCVDTDQLASSAGQELIKTWQKCRQTDKASNVQTEQHNQVNLYVQNKLCIYHNYSDRYARANSEDPDQMPQNVTSDQSLHIFATHTAVLKESSDTANFSWTGTSQYY